MKDFSRDMGRYAKLNRQSSKNIEMIDQLFYRQFKRQMLCQDSKVERTSHKNHKRKMRRRLQSIHKEWDRIEVI